MNFKRVFFVAILAIIWSNSDPSLRAPPFAQRSPKNLPIDKLFSNYNFTVVRAASL